MIRRSLIMLALSANLAWSAPAQPDPGLHVYEATVALVSRLYLDIEEVTPEEAMRNALVGVSQELDWMLFEQPVPGIFVLRHGDGRALGQVEVRGWASLVRALATAEKVLAEEDPSLDRAELQISLVSGLTAALDRYSRVLSGASLDRFEDRIRGEMVGIGASIRLTDDELHITGVTDDAPASRGGLQAGDVLVAIDGQSTVNMPVREAVRRIRGELGTEVILSVRRGVETLDLTFERGRVPLKTVRHEVLEGGVGYVHIDHMSQQTVKDFEEVLDLLTAEGGLEHGLVLDLRSNGGGSLKASAGVVDHFVTEGLITVTRGADGRAVPNLVHQLRAGTRGRLHDLPVVVLVNERTASGAEIISGALQAMDRTVVIGRRTFGKGKVQKIYNLSDAARLKLTVAEYLLTDDRPVDDVGVTPDVHTGPVLFRDDDVRFAWSEVERADVSADALLPLPRLVAEEAVDVERELARRVLLATNATTTEGMSVALAEQAEKMRAEQEQVLFSELSARNVDWSVAQAPAAAVLDAKVWVERDPDDADAVWVHARVRNGSGAGVHRTLVELRSDSSSSLDGLMVPIGSVPGGSMGEGRVRLDLRPGQPPRMDEVQIWLHAHGQQARNVGTDHLVASSSPPPHLRVETKLQGKGADRTVLVTLSNRGTHELQGLEAYFAWPNDVDVELVDRAARIPSLAAGKETRLKLGLRLGEDLPESFPLRLVLEADDHGVLQRWEVELASNGKPSAYEAPLVQLATDGPIWTTDATTTAPVRITDDGTLDHVAVFVNGEKVYWHGPTTELDLGGVVYHLEPGDNWVVFRAEDDQGLVTQQGFHMHRKAGGDEALTDNGD